MCGIAGILNFDQIPVDLSILGAMTETLSSRGPDDTGYWQESFIAFGHKRLSIIDLSNAGHQPYVDMPSGCFLVYNGEIYNYVELRKELERNGYTFTSKTDTEVLLKSYLFWGKKCLDKFNGMFAFAIWDSKQRKLFAARDRIGIKPFYYLLNDKGFIFASRPKAIMQHPLCNTSLDRKALSVYLDLGYAPGDMAMIAGIKKLKPGHYLEITNNSTVNIDQYWSLSQTWCSPETDLSIEESSHELFRLISDSVKLRMVADVPLGVFLSGGIDSGAVSAGMASQIDMSRMKTFCMNFSGDDGLDARYARALADHLGSQHYEYDFNPDNLITAVEKLAEVYDEPIADISLLPSMALSEYVRKEVTVCLSGDGGDELFAGYPNYKRLQWFSAIRRVPGLRWLIRGLLALKGGHRSSLAVEALKFKTVSEIAAFIRSARKDNARPLLDDDMSYGFQDVASETLNALKHLDIVKQGSYLDACYFMVDDNLHKMDVASMAHGLEVRVPLLDHRIVEFAARLPVSYKIYHNQQKYVLKKAVERMMPEGYFTRPKTGFAPPIGKWIRNELKDWIYAELSSDSLDELGVLDPSAIKSIIDSHMSGNRDFSSYIWLLVSLVRWQKYYRVR